MRRPLRQEQQGVPAYERDLERAMESCDDLARLNDDDLCARLNQNVHVSYLLYFFRSNHAASLYCLRASI